MANFKSKYGSLQLPYKARVMKGDTIIENAEMICFEKGSFSTDDKSKIEFLREGRWKELVSEITFIGQQIKKEDAPPSAPVKPVVPAPGKKPVVKKEDAPPSAPVKPVVEDESTPGTGE